MDRPLRRLCQRRDTYQSGNRRSPDRRKATSLLLVGVTAIIGDFEKNDIVKIINETGVQIGVGCAGYDSREATGLIGQRDLKPLVHYDYLYLD